MAILTAILSLVSRQLGNIVQAIFGWSITALFGRLPSQKQTALSVALILAIAWPLLVVGGFLPGVAAWVLAFLPLHKWLSDTAMRIVWLTLALVVPLGVGAIARWITPERKLHGGTIRTLLGGYRLTIGYAVAFVITAFSVPIVKILSTAKGWDDDHVYVQPKEKHFYAVLDELAAACHAAGKPVIREPAPTSMALSSRVIKWFARGIVDPIVPADPQRLRGDGIELYLYPSDLLLRGERKTLARIRAEMTRTMIEQHAYLAEEAGAQEIEDEIQHMWELVARHEGPKEIGEIARTRLREIAKRLDEAGISYEAWVTLESSVRRLERAIAGGPSILDMHPGPDTHKLVALERRAMPSTSTRKLVEQALDEAKELARLEVALAKDELHREAKSAAEGATLLGVALLLELLAIFAFAAVMVLALAKALAIPIAIGAALIVCATFAAAHAYKVLPRSIVGHTRERVGHDAEEVAAHVLH
jgi:hypothetical protein